MLTLEIVGLNGVDVDKKDQRSQKLTSRPKERPVMLRGMTIVITMIKDTLKLTKYGTEYNLKSRLPT